MTSSSWPRRLLSTAASTLARRVRALPPTRYSNDGHKTADLTATKTKRQIQAPCGSSCMFLNN